MIIVRSMRFVDERGYRREGRLVDGSIEAGGCSYDPEDVTPLPPCRPSKIVCVGLNYADHARETDSSTPDRPLLFVKTPNTVTAHGRTITLPDPEKHYEHEGELGVVIDRQANRVSEENALKYVRGFTPFNDLSNRTDQRREQNWIRGKCFDGAAPIGPVLATPDEVPEDATIACRVNGTTRQSAERSSMIFGVPELIEEITAYVTLEPGDVVATGTPAGVGPIGDGDTVEVDVEGVGTLRNRIRGTSP